jgi:hypothetical protein
MADSPTWEDVVSRVCIASNYNALAQAAQQWHDAMTKAQTLQTEIGQVSQRVVAWTGSGGDEFRNYIKKLSTAVRTNIDSHQKMWVGLENCAKHLREAIGAIPIPDFMRPSIEQMRAAGGSSATLEPGVFLRMVEGMATQGRTGADLMNARQQARVWYDSNQEKARQAYAQLSAAYAREMVNFPQGVTVKMPGTAPATQKSGSSATKKPATASRTTNPFSGVPTTPATTMPTMPTTPAMASLPTGLTLPTTDPSLGGLDPLTGGPSSTLPALDPLKSPALSTGLAGTGSHLGGAGLGGGIPGGAGGGFAGKLPPLGPSVSPPDMMGGAVAGAVGGPATAGPGAAGQPAGGTGAGAGMMPMSPHGAKGDGQDWRNATLMDDGGYFDPADVTSGLIT